jgi:hypothetical protein
VADVPLIPGHQIYVDLVPRQNILPSQPLASHDDSGRGSHSSNPDNDGSSSNFLQNEDQQNDQENVFSDTDNTVNSNRPINDQNGQAGSGSSDTTTQSGVSSSDSSDTPSGVGSVSSDTLSSVSSSDTTTQSSISNSGSSDTPSGVGNISSDTSLSVSSSNSSLLEIEELASSNFSDTLAVLVTVLNTLNEEDDIDINEESDIETFLCTVVHLTRRN